MEDKWVDKISRNIDSKVDEFISVRDYRFYQIEKLKRIASLLDKQADCLDCKYLKKELESLVNELDRLINKSGVNRREYEKKVEALIKHLKDQHQVYQAYHFTYTYSAIFTFAGAIFGLVLSYGLFYGFDATIFFLSAGVGMFAGNVLGAKKDKACVKSGRQI